MKKTVSAVLACLLLFAAAGFAGCAEQPQQEEQPEETNPNVVTLYDFEDYATDVEPLILLNYFGKVSLNTDAQYVRSGGGSLKMVPEGCPSEGSDLAPTLKVPLNIDREEIEENDISQLTRISAEIYNASDKDVSLRTQLQFFGGSTANASDHTLVPGWNTVLISVNAQVLGISYDITDCKGILFAFGQADPAPTLYMDDIILYKTETPYTPMEFTVDPGEICSFDKLYQQYVVVPYNAFENNVPVLSINSDLNYAYKGRSLKVEMPANDGSFQTGDSSNYSYTGFSLSQGFMEKVNMAQYSEDMYFSFWVLNTGSSQQRLFIHFYNTDGEVYSSVTNIYVPAGEWYNVRIPLSDLSQGTESTSWRSAGEIYINWEINTLNEDRVMYYDEFAVVEGEDGQ